VGADFKRSVRGASNICQVTFQLLTRPLYLEMAYGPASGVVSCEACPSRVRTQAATAAAAAAATASATAKTAHVQGYRTSRRAAKRIKKWRDTETKGAIREV